MINSHLDKPTDELVIFTDGSCNKFQTKAGIGIYFENKNDFTNDLFADVADPLVLPRTNNRAELTAIFQAIAICVKKSFSHNLRIVTDSK
jgi:ribonuclease HI